MYFAPANIAILAVSLSRTVPAPSNNLLTVGKEDPVRVDEHYLAEIIEARMRQIFQTLLDELDKIDALDLPGGFVITGGGATLPGVIDLAKEYFGERVRLFIPEQMGVRNPIYTTSVGISHYVAGLDDIHRIAQGTYQIDRPATQSTSTSLPPQQEVPQARSHVQSNVRAAKQETAPGYNDYQASNQSDYYEEIEPVVQRNKGQGKFSQFIEKIKAFFESFFD